MKFIVRVSGNPFGTTPGTREIYRGRYTHMRSEGSWLLGVALNLARNGHEVVIAEYQWGDQGEYPLPQNVRLSHNVCGECDVFIDCGWDNVHTVEMYSRVKAKLYVHGWGGVPQSSHMLDFVNERNLKNHFMARTSRACHREATKYPFNIYMPVPITEKIPDIGNFSSKKMLWANRGAFNEAYRPDSEPVLEFMENNQDYHYTVLLWGDVKEKALMIGRPDIISRFESLRNVKLLEPYTGIPNDEFLSELRASKFLLDTGHPGIHPQNLEAVCMGCVPFVYTDREHHFYDLPADIRVPDSYVLNGPHGIERIINDESLYQEYYARLADTAKDHEYDNSYNIFMKEINERL